MKKAERMYISFKIRKCPNPAFAIIYMRLQQSKNRLEFSLNLKIKTSTWNTHKNQVKGNPAITDLLTAYTAKAREIRLQNPDISLEEIRDRLFGKQIKIEAPRAKTLVEVGNLLLKKKLRKYQLKKLKPATLRKAKERQQNLEWIFKKTKWKWPLESIRTEHLEHLETWLRNKTSWHYNTVSKIMNFVKEVIKFGMAEGIIPTRPIVHRVHFLPTEHRALTAAQVKQIAETKWKNPIIQAVADCFLFQCYTGLAYADLRQFDAAIHLKVNSFTELIELSRAKSPAEGKSYLAKVPLLPAAKRILEKYNYRLEVLANQNYNPYLHLIGESLKLEWKLTSHVARKTFCTILFNSGMSIEMIGEWVGHSTAKTTLSHYVRGDAEAMKKEVIILGYGT